MKTFSQKKKTERNLFQEQMTMKALASEIPHPTVTQVLTKKNPVQRTTLQQLNFSGPQTQKWIIWLIRFVHETLWVRESRSPISNQNICKIICQNTQSEARQEGIWGATKISCCNKNEAVAWWVWFQTSCCEQIEWKAFWASCEGQPCSRKMAASRDFEQRLKKEVSVAQSAITCAKHQWDMPNVSFKPRLKSWSHITQAKEKFWWRFGRDADQT